LRVLEHVLRPSQAASLAPADTVTPFLATVIAGASAEVLARYVAALQDEGVRVVGDFKDVELVDLAKCITVKADLRKVKGAIVERWGAAACVAETPVSTPAPATGQAGGGGGGGGGSTFPPAFIPAGYTFKAWLRIGKVCLCTNKVGADVAVKVTRDSRCWEHERAMLKVRLCSAVLCCAVLGCAVLCCAVLCYDVLCLWCFRSVKSTGGSCNNPRAQLAASTGVVVQLLDVSDGRGPDGLTWFALVFELLDTTVAGMREGMWRELGDCDSTLHPIELTCFPAGDKRNVTRVTCCQLLLCLIMLRARPQM
jgi:hypothetical protein